MKINKVFPRRTGMRWALALGTGMLFQIYLAFRLHSYWFVLFALLIAVTFCFNLKYTDWRKV